MARVGETGRTWQGTSLALVHTMLKTGDEERRKQETADRRDRSPE